MFVTCKLDCRFTNHKTEKTFQLSSKVKAGRKMDKIRLILTLVTIAIVVIPIVGMLLAYQGNLLGLFVPPEINQIADDFMGGDGGGNNGDNGPGLEPPTMVGEPTYDEEAGTFSAFEFTNSFPIDITINSLSGNIECVEHHFTLGTANLSDAVSIDAGETGTLTVNGQWTDAGKLHFQNAHASEEFVDVVLTNLAVDISGIQLQMDENQMGEMQVPNPAFQG
jgi:hypothetical protein